MPDSSRDLVVGDAFGGVSVPWHLTTVEYVEELRRVLRPDGVYAVNIIDFHPLGFARAELATLRRVFDHVALAADAFTLSGNGGGNLVAIASDSPIDKARHRARLREAAARPGTSSTATGSPSGSTGRRC